MQMRDKYLRLQNDMQNAQISHQKEKEDFAIQIHELKLTAQHLREPGEVVANQARDYLREKNQELVDALIGQERLAEKFKWELKKTSETLESEGRKNEQLRRENRKMKAYVEHLLRSQKGGKREEVSEPVPQEMPQQ